MSVRPALGVFGGTFDPVHFGHLRAASEVRERLSLDRFRLMPAGDPPHRSHTHASARQRLAMLRLAVSNHPDLGVDDREIRREGVSYMVDTLAEIRAEEGERPVLLIIGQDSANGLEGWHEWQRLFHLAHVVIMTRPGAGHEYGDALAAEIRARMVSNERLLSEGPSGHVLYLPVTQLAISSTGIREEIGAGRSPRFLLPEPVLDYIRREGLYR